MALAVLDQRDGEAASTPTTRTSWFTSCSCKLETGAPDPAEITVTTSNVLLYPQLESFIRIRMTEFDRIREERVDRLSEIATFIEERIVAGDAVRLILICTSNSRRSHMAHIWAWTAAHVHRVTGVDTHSGGTVATAFDSRAVAALRRAGFSIERQSQGHNPVYAVSFNTEVEPMKCFSKRFDQPPNPRDDFCAVMTCSSADAECPFVVGAAKRVAIPYDDPREFDGTDQESTMYDDCCRQISREMLYLFSRVEL